MALHILGTFKPSRSVKGSKAMRNHKIIYNRGISSFVYTDKVIGLGKAIRESKIDDVIFRNNDNTLQLSTLNQPYTWFSVNESRRLIIRKVYHDIWNMINQAYNDRNVAISDGNETEYSRALILGNSGIGKTVSMNFYLKKAIEQHYPVIMETRRSRYYFEPGNDDVWKEHVKLGAELVKLQEDTSVLLFHDHEQKKEPPILDNGAFTVAAVSPDTSNCKEYSKHKCLELWLPLQSIDEIRGMRDIIKPFINDEELNKRISYVGRNVRNIFAPNFQKVLVKLDERILEFDLDKFITSEMFTRAMIPNSISGLSWWVVHVDASPDLESYGKIDWASDYVRDAVLSNTHSKDLHQLRSICCSMLKSPVVGPETNRNI